MSTRVPGARLGWSALVGDLGRPSERSRTVRVLVFLALAISVGAASTTDAISASGALAAVLAMALGSVVAGRRRDDLHAWIAVGVTAVTVVLVARFMTTHLSVATPAELRAPLAQLLITMECCRTFAMRTRRELRFALSSSSAMVAVAASMSLSFTFIVPLTGWAIVVAAAIAAAHRSDLRERMDHADGPRARPGVRSILPAVVGIALAGIVGIGVFLIVPAAKSSRFLANIAHLPRSTPVPRQGDLSNPSLGANNPSGGTEGPEGGQAQTFGYFGFSKTLDTGVRGRPDDTLVMRVRSSTPDFWRGQSFDLWDGRTWTMSDERTRVLAGGSPIQVSVLPDDPPVRSDELIQTYFLETSGPNVIFGAARPSQVYIPQAALFQLQDGTLRTGVELEAGSIYTVVSQRPYATPQRLRSSGDTAETAPEALQVRYGAMPIATRRVVDLAEQLVQGQPTTYDKVMAIQDWMGKNTKYSVDIPPLPPTTDAVDQFLFVDRVGFCEQIATSLVVMLRSQGIPARLAVGYAAGERNPFTGLYEVRAKDAHAWAEVYFPSVGWQAFDPTASVPLSGDPPPDAARVGLGTYLNAHFGRYVRPGAALLAGLVALGLFAALWRPTRAFVARRRRRANATWAELTLIRLEAIGTKLGRPRGTGETAREYARALQRTVLPDERFTPIIDAMERDAYGPLPVDDEERLEATRMLDELAEVSR